jgi:hypothetical protein
MDTNKIFYIKELNDKIFNPTIFHNYINIVFIYTPPKVGSTTLISSLRLSGAKFCIAIHIHDENMLNILTQYKNYHNVTILDIIYYNSSIGKNVFVIDVYRTPVERKLSDYFENISNFHFNNNEEFIINYDNNKIIDRFNSIFPHIANIEYFNDIYNIDVPTSFDFDNKFIMTINQNVKFIKIRLQDSNHWGQILTHLLGFEVLIIKDYITENKKIGILYNRIKNEYKIPINFLEYIQNDKYFLFYNSPLERELYLTSLANNQTNFFLPFSDSEFKFYLKISNQNQYHNFIQRNHYLDLGCICNACSNKRFNIITKIKKRDYTDYTDYTDYLNSRVYHEQAVYEQNIHKLNTIRNKINYEITKHYNDKNKHKNKHNQNNQHIVKLNMRNIITN